jgi:CheY-like chemotaxis protein
VSGKVLVVEDDFLIRESLLEILQDNGFQVAGASHGKDALAHLETTDIRPCVILLDLMMPVMDGRAFREEQLRRAAIADIPVVVVSAHHDVAEQVKDLKATSFLRKPVKLAELLRVVRECCSPPATSP